MSVCQQCGMECPHHKMSCSESEPAERLEADESDDTALVTALEARIDELERENAKLWRIDEGRKRQVAFLDERLAELESELAKLRAEPERPTGRRS
jgi:hypothetical protein